MGSCLTLYGAKGDDFMTWTAAMSVSQVTPSSMCAVRISGRLPRTSRPRRGSCERSRCRLALVMSLPVRSWCRSASPAWREIQFAFRHS